jgi:hypothetical protein
MSDSSDDYQLPSWPPTPINRNLWNAVMGSIGSRLRAREALEANFTALIERGTQASLDYIQATVAPQVARLQDQIVLAQEQIDQIVVDGISPNAAKLGGQLPAYYASAAALSSGLLSRVPVTRTIAGHSLDENITLSRNDVGLGNVNNTADADKPISADAAAALANRVRFDAAQSITLAQRGQARANIDAGVLSGFRNRLINGGFDWWQRGFVFNNPANGAYVADRWCVLHDDVAATFNITARGATNEAISPDTWRYLEWNQTAATTATTRNLIQRIENVRTLAGRRATLTFAAWSDAPRTIGAWLRQNFGTGGSTSALVNTAIQTVSLTTTPTTFSLVFDVPSVSGKLVGTNANDCLELIFNMPLTGTFGIRISRVSLVEGDATGEEDPFAARHIQQELALCQRYYEWGAGVALPAVAFNYRTHHFKVTKRAAPSIVTSNGMVTTTSDPTGNFYQDMPVAGIGAFRWTADAEL